MITLNLSKAEIVDNKNYWVDDQEEGLSTVRINSIIEDIRGDKIERKQKHGIITK